MLFAVLALLCAGCQLDLQLDVAVDADGAGEVAISVAADADLLERARQADVDPLADLAAAGASLESAGWRLTERRDGGGAQVRLSAPFSGAVEFNTLVTDLARTLDAPEVTLLEGLRLEVTEEEISVTGAAGLVPTPVVAELGLTPARAVELADEAVSYRVAVTLPAEVIASTADRGDGSALVWQVPAGERVEITAVGVRPSPPVWPLVLGAVGGTLVAALLLHRLRARR